MVNHRSRCIAPAKAIPQNNALTVVIASAGIGRRMKGRGAKALLPVYQNVPILEMQIRTIWKMYPNAEIICCVGFQADKVRETFRGTFPIRFVSNERYESTNVMHSIALALQSSLPSNLLIMHGDILFNTNVLGDIEGDQSKILVIPTKNEQEVGAVVQDGIVTNLSYGLETLWGQMVYLTAKEAKLFESVAFDEDHSSHLFLYEGINEVINRGGIFKMHSPANAKFLEIDKVEDLSKIRSLLL